MTQGTRQGREPPRRQEPRPPGLLGVFPFLGALAPARLRSALARKEVAFGVAGAALLALAVVFQFPATRLHAGSRLKTSPFKWTSDVERQALEKKGYFLYMPKGGSLRFFSLGNDALAASYVWIKAAGYVTREFGTPAGAAAGDREAGARRKFEWLSKLYGTVFELDPRWVGACRLGAMVLAAVGRDPSGAIDLLERGISANPDSWLLPYEAGVTMLMWPGHEEEAARYFKMAAQRPMDPDRKNTIEHVIPHLVAEAGRLEEAIRLTRKRAFDFEGQVMGESSRRRLREYVARQLELDLAEGVADFREREGRFPADIPELRRAGLLAKFDFHFAQAVFACADRLAVLQELFRRAHPQAPALEDLTALARSGFLHKAVLAGLFEPPEWRDTYGKRFLYHAPTGTLRSEGLAEVDAARTAAVLTSAVGTFGLRKRRRPGSLEELCAYFGRRIAEGRQLEQGWVPAFRGGRPPEHPLAAWGWAYEYDAEAGRVDIRKRRSGSAADRARSEGKGDDVGE